MTTTIHPHTRRRMDRDRRHVNRVTRAQRATCRKRVPFDPSAPFAFYRDGQPIVGADRHRIHGALLSDDAYRQVAFSRFGEGYSVSTVWIGVDMSHSGTTPLIFETLALVDGHEMQMRYPTERLARITHYALARVIEAAYRRHVAAALVTCATAEIDVLLTPDADDVTGDTTP